MTVGLPCRYISFVYILAWLGAGLKAFSVQCCHNLHVANVNDSDALAKNIQYF